MPLVFFISAADPRFTSTLDQILKTPEKGGLTANNSVYRYDPTKSDDGVGGEEGAFSLCTLWTVEALTRAGVYDPKYLDKARVDLSVHDVHADDAECTCLSTLWDTGTTSSCTARKSPAGEKDSE